MPLEDILIWPLLGAEILLLGHFFSLGRHEPLFVGPQHLVDAIELFRTEIHYRCSGSLNHEERELVPLFSVAPAANFGPSGKLEPEHLPVVLLSSVVL